MKAAVLIKRIWVGNVWIQMEVVRDLLGWKPMHGRTYPVKP